MNDITITYGINQYHVIDITQAVLQTCLNDNILLIKRGTDFNDFGGDPHFGQTKTLFVKYCQNGKVYHKFYGERCNFDIKIDFNNSVNDSLNDFIRSKIAVIYVYYERIDEQKNQTNLAYFIKYAMDKNLWYDLDITYLFVINGHQCEVVIPSYHNVHILKEDNCSDWEGWANGIKYFEKTFQCPIWQSFDYLCTINAGTIGPIMESNTNDHWLFPFYKKIKINNAVICSPCISFFSPYHQTGPGQRVVPIFTLIKIDEKIIKHLMHDKVKNINNESLYRGEEYYNTVFGPKKNKEDAILTGEYGLSKILIDNGYRVTSLLYDDNIDVNDRSNWGINNFTEPDRFRSFNGVFLPLSTIFIKNVWRMSGDVISYASLPVLYHECVDFVHRKLGMVDIFRDVNVDYRYDLLPLEKYVAYGTGEKYYQDFLCAEELILHVKSGKDCRSCAIYAHYDQDNLIKDYVIQAINTLIYLGYEVLFFTASDTLKNVSILPCKTFFVKNEGHGTDMKIWLRACQHIMFSDAKYEWIMFLNDSLLLPINGINNFKNTIDEMRQKSDFWGHWDSPECVPHIICAVVEFKFKMIKDVVMFFQEAIEKCTSKGDYIQILEVNFSNNLVSKGYVGNVVIDEKTLSGKEGLTCPIFNPYIIRQWINNPRSFAIKWKYCIRYLESQCVSPEFRYLARFLHFGPYGLKLDIEECGMFPSSFTFVPK
uniref:Uncharacterized protein n=1 Tax=viral metagenome TaxID=1070528 RepID=A0A6C0C8A7_9ZZZZ